MHQLIFAFLIVSFASAAPISPPRERAQPNRKVSNLCCKQAAGFQIMSRLFLLVFSGPVNNAVSYLHSCTQAFTFPHVFGFSCFF